MTIIQTKFLLKSIKTLLSLLNFFEFGISQENRQDQEKNLDGQKLENRIHPKLKLQHTSSMTIYIVYT